MVGVLTAMRGTLFEPETIDYVAWMASVFIAAALTIIGLFMLSWAIKNHWDKV